jgi:hypothetical protein
MPNNNSLRAHLSDLASSFANAVIDAIRGASIDELVADHGGARRAPGRPRSAPAAKPAPVAGAAARSSKPKGRLARRSPADIAKTLGRVVTLLKSKKAGLRSEQIQAALGLDRREVPRVLKEGLTKKQLRSKGQKRATVYSVS